MSCSTSEAGCLDLLKVVDDLAGDLHGHGRAAGVDLFDGLEDFGGGHVLKQVAAGAVAQRIKDQIAVLVGRQHQHLDLGQPLFEAGDTLDAAHAGQVDVHQHDVRLLGGNSLQGLLAIPVRTDAAKRRRTAQQLRQALAGAPAIFDDGDFDRHRVCVRFCARRPGGAIEQTFYSGEAVFRGKGFLPAGVELVQEALKQWLVPGQIGDIHVLLWIGGMIVQLVELLLAARGGPFHQPVAIRAQRAPEAFAHAGNLLGVDAEGGGLPIAPGVFDERPEALALEICRRRDLTQLGKRRIYVHAARESLPTGGATQSNKRSSQLRL